NKLKTFSPPALVRCSEETVSVIVIVRMNTRVSILVRQCFPKVTKEQRLRSAVDEGIHKSSSRLLKNPSESFDKLETNGSEVKIIEKNSFMLGSSKHVSPFFSILLKSKLRPLERRSLC